MQRKAYATALVVALLVAAGCLGGGGTTTPTDRDTPGPDASPAERLRYQAVTTMEAVETARYDLSMKVRTERRALTLSTRGVLDRTARKQHANVTVTVDEPVPRTVTTETYVNGSTMYQKTMGIWRTQDVSDRNVWNSTQVGQSRAMLEAVSVSMAGNATVHGTETHVLALEAEDLDAFQEAIDEQLTGSGRSSVDGEVTSFSARAYVDPDTGYLLGMEANMSIGADGSTAEVSMTITYSDIDEPVTIEIPEEAKGEGQRAALESSAPAGVDGG